MLKRFSSFILAPVIASSVLAVTARPGNEHVCKMAGMQMPPASTTLSPSHEMMPGMHMPPASTTLNPSHEMMPAMEMPPASSTLSPSHEMMPSREAMDHGMQMVHGMQMTDHGVETMPGMETMPCCKKHATQSVSNESGSSGQCCVNIPHEPDSTGTTLNLRRPSFSVAVIHPAVVQSPLAAPKPYECSYSTKVFLPNLQASYIRNLSILI